MRSGIENLVRRESMLKIAGAAAVIALCVPTHAMAQAPAHESEDGAKAVKHVMVRVGGPDGATGNVAFTSFMEPQETVAQAPYSADAVTEVTQTLADGNRINRRTVSKIYRDGAGRVRREQAIAGLGPLGAATEGMRFVFLEDPVAKTAYTLDPVRQEARKMPTDLHVNVRHMAGASTVTAADTETGPARVERKIEKRVIVTRDGSGQEHVSESMGEGDGPMTHAEVMTGAMDPTEMPRGASEPLGSSSIDGVNAEGTRWTQTIPAGAMGNERPIEIVTERWYSPELKTVVLAKHRDPRVGETVYQLSNIVRAEPPADLFVVPADYKVVEGPGFATVSDSKVVRPE
jgi:hypothetical protein